MKPQSTKELFNSLEDEMRLMLLVAGVLFSSSIFSAPATSLYMGADAQVRQMPSYKDSGRNVYTASAPQLHVSGGYKLNDFFAIEGGAYASKSKVHASGNKIRARGIHLGLVGFYPVAEGMSLVGGLAASHLKINTKELVTSIEKDPAHIVPDITKTILCKGKRIRINPRIMAGLQYTLTDNISLRLTGVWERTSRMISNSAKVQNSMNYGFGALYAF